jgi:hypothetical protein
LDFLGNIGLSCSWNSLGNFCDLEGGGARGAECRVRNRQFIKLQDKFYNSTLKVKLRSIL